MGCKNAENANQSETLAWVESSNGRLVAKKETKLKKNSNSASSVADYCAIPAGAVLNVLKYDNEFASGKHVKVLINTTAKLDNCDWAKSAAAEEEGEQTAVPPEEPVSQSSPSSTAGQSPGGQTSWGSVMQTSADQEGTSPTSYVESADYQGFIWLDDFSPAAPNSALAMQQEDVGEAGATFEGKKVDSQLGQRLAQYVYKNRVGFRGKCWTYVQRAVNAVILGNKPSVVSLPGNSKDNIGRLAEPRFRMCRAENVSLAALPVGSILIYRPGTCGYSRKAGHGEIKVSNNQYCSDGCQSAKPSCPKADAAFFPCVK